VAALDFEQKVAHKHGSSEASFNVT